MKKFINKLTGKMVVASLRAKTTICSKRGDGYVSEAVKILLAVVLGALLLAGLYLLFNNIVLPTLSEKIKDLFNYSS